MKKIAVMTDSSADITSSEANELDLIVIRMPISINEDQYTEDIDMNTEQLMEKMKQGYVAKTAQPIAGYLYTMVEETLKEYDHIIYIPISSGLSGSYQTAVSILKDFENKVTIIDARHVCYLLTDLCMQVKGLINDGLEPSAIKELVESNANMWACLVPNDLQYLKRGGRISQAAASLANLLKITPILKVENGAIDVFDKVRTLKKAYQVSVDTLANYGNPEDHNYYVLYTEIEDDAKEQARILSERINQPVKIHPIGAVVTAHVGPGTLGFGIINKVRK